MRISIVSILQARKDVGRGVQPSRHILRVGSLSLWRGAERVVGRSNLLATLGRPDRYHCGANFDIGRATILALRARWIDLVASRFEVSHRVARTTVSAPWVRVLSLWRGAAFS